MCLALKPKANTGSSRDHTRPLSQAAYRLEIINDRFRKRPVTKGLARKTTVTILIVLEFIIIEG